MNSVFSGTRKTELSEALPRTYFVFSIEPCRAEHLIRLGCGGICGRVGGQPVMGIKLNPNRGRYTPFRSLRLDPLGSPGSARQGCCRQAGSPLRISLP